MTEATTVSKGRPGRIEEWRTGGGPPHPEFASCLGDWSHESSPTDPMLGELVMIAPRLHLHSRIETFPLSWRVEKQKDRYELDEGELGIRAVIYANASRFVWAETYIGAMLRVAETIHPQLLDIVPIVARLVPIVHEFHAVLRRFFHHKVKRPLLDAAAPDRKVFQKFAATSTNTIYIRIGAENLLEMRLLLEYGSGDVKIETAASSEEFTQLHATLLLVGLRHVWFGMDSRWRDDVGEWHYRMPPGKLKIWRSNIIYARAIDPNAHFEETEEEGGTRNYFTALSLRYLPPCWPKSRQGDVIFNDTNSISIQASNYFLKRGRYMGEKVESGKLSSSSSSRLFYPSSLATYGTAIGKQSLAESFVAEYGKKRASSLQQLWDVVANAASLKARSEERHPTSYYASVEKVSAFARRIEIENESGDIIGFNVSAKFDAQAKGSIDVTISIITPPEGGSHVMSALDSISKVLSKELDIVINVST